DAARGREDELRTVAAEGDERDTIAPLVGVIEQAEDRALHARHAAARAHRAGRIDAEHDEIALLAGPDVLAQVISMEPRTVRLDRAARGGCAQRGREREIGHRALRLPAVDGRATGRPAPASSLALADARELEERRPPGGVGSVGARARRSV